MRNAVGALILTASVLVACKLGDAKYEGNCNASAIEDKQFCFEYTKDNFEDAKKLCASWSATWSDGPCDRTNALGSCKVMGNRKVFYKGTQFPTVDAAKTACADPSNWSDK